MIDFFLRPKWPLLNRILYGTGLVIFAISILLLFYFHLNNQSFVFPIEKTLIPDFVKVKLYNFITPFGDFSPEINSLVNFQKYVSSGFYMPILAGNLFAILFFFTLTFLSAIIIKLPKWGFYIGLSLLVLYLIYSNIQEFGIIDLYKDSFLIICLILIIGGIFTLRNFFYEKALWFHFLFSFIIWSVIWISIFQFGKGNEILFQLGNNSLGASLIISIVFITLLAHEPIHIFFVMISYSSNRNSKGRLVNFILISVLYFANVSLAYLKTIGKVDWEIVYTPFELLILFSVLCGAYGFSLRFPSEKYFGANYRTMMIFSVLSAFLFGFISFAEFAGHDAIIEVLEDVTLYSHIAMGTLFFFYTIINFGDLLSQNVKAYKVAYKPNRFPLATALIGGYIVMVILLMRSSMFPYYQFRGAVYNGMADNYFVNGDIKMAEVFYEEASVFALDNRRSNACLAYIYKEKEMRAQNAISLKKALTKQPIPELYIELSERFESSKSFFDAVFTLQEGVGKFPSSKAINNNLGLLYSKSNVIDSAFIYFNKSDDESKERNLSAMLSKVGYNNPDSLPDLENFDLSEISNRISIYNKIHKEYETSEDYDILKDSIIDFGEYSYYYNYLLNKILSRGEFPEEYVNGLLEVQLPESYLRDIYLLNGLFKFYSNNIHASVSDFENSENFSGFTASYISDLTGTVLWTRKMYSAAEEKLEKAARLNYKNASLKLFAFYVETSNKEDAKFQFRKAFRDIDLTPEEDSLWTRLLRGEFEIRNFDSLDEKQKYTAFKLYPAKFSTQNLMNLPENFSDESFKDRLASEIINYFTHRFDYNTLELFYQKWNTKLNRKNELLSEYLRHLNASGNDQKFLNVYEKENVENLDNPLFDAWYNKLKGNKSEYQKTLAIAVERMGYDPEVFLLKLEEMKAKNIESHVLYEEVLGYVQVYPEHPGLKKAYILEAINFGLPTYAEHEMEHLKDLIPRSEYEKFEIVYLDALQNDTSAHNWE